MTLHSVQFAGGESRWMRRLGKLAVVLSLTAVLASAQVSPTPEQQLQQQLDAVEKSLQLAQHQIDAYHSELFELQQQVQSLQRQLNTGAAETSSTQSNQAAADLRQAVADLQEQQSIHQAEIQVHEQAKVETASKYSLKIHGLVLFNALSNDGAVDQPKLPTFAIPRTDTVDHGSLVATARQTLLGLGATGPTLGGAHTYADVSMDFSGGSFTGAYINPGLLRLRTAMLQIAWPHTTLQAGVDDLILTPYYATSYFNVAQPAMSWSGALWDWAPQISVEHYFQLSHTQRLTLQAALADIPDAGTTTGKAVGVVSAAERSKYPATEARAAYHWGTRRLGSIGAGGYFSPHTYGLHEATQSNPSLTGSLDAWAATADWQVSFPGQLQFSGEVYKGSALGGVGAGAFKDYAAVYLPTAGNASATRLVGLKDVGGWAQFKFRPVERIEFNFAFGEDNANASQLRNADLDLTNPYGGLARNQTAFGNIVFHPYSTFLLSTEYRRIRSWQVYGPASGAQFFGLAAGYEF